MLLITGAVMVALEQLNIGLMKQESRSRSPVAMPICPAKPSNLSWAGGINEVGGNIVKRFVWSAGTENDETN